MNDVCFLTRNYDVAVGHTNNTKIRILSIDARRKFIVFLNLSTGKRDVLPRIRFELDVKNKKRSTISFRLQRLQFPIRLAYAMSINKSQGQTLTRVAVDLREPYFSHGQLYVALGRVRHRHGALVLTTPAHYSDTAKVHYTMNVVHRGLLR